MDSVTTVLMVRHADVYNPQNIVYGRLPRFRLSAVGRRQVLELAAALHGIQVDAIYLSPRLRARETARTLGQQLGCNRLRRSSLIDEVLTGYQGQPNSILTPTMNFYDTPASDSDETIAMVARRMERFLHLALRRHAGRAVIAVSHADPIMILRAQTLGLPLVIRSIQGRYYPAKCSVMQFSQVGCEARPIVVYRQLIRDETKAPAKSRPAGSTQSDSAKGVGI